MSGETSGYEPSQFTTEAEYQTALEQVAHRWGSTSTPEDYRPDELVTRIANYEAGFGPERPPHHPALSDEDVERLRPDLTDVAGWLICRYPDLVGRVSLCRHQGQPIGELAAVLTSDVAEVYGRSSRDEAEAALRALGYVIAPDWSRLSRELQSPKAAEISQHRKLERYDRVEQVMRAS